MTKPGKHCERTTCTRAATVGRLCRSHHNAAKQRGEVGYTPAEPVREHIRKLRAVGWNFESIARTAGVSPSGLRDMFSRNLSRCWRYTANPILAIAVDPCGSMASCDATGYRRRVRALQRIGWTYRDICERAGVTMSCLAATMAGARETSSASALAIANAYEVMQMHRGPSQHTATWAKNRGYPPPFAWDDDTIDDPAAEPSMQEGEVVDEVAVERVVSGHAKPSSLTLPERYAAAKVMIEKGAAPSTAATKLGLNRRNVAEVTERLAA